MCKLYDKPHCESFFSIGLNDSRQLPSKIMRQKTSPDPVLYTESPKTGTPEEITCFMY